MLLARNSEESYVILKKEGGKLHQLKAAELMYKKWTKEDVSSKGRAPDYTQQVRFGN